MRGRAEVQALLRRTDVPLRETVELESLDLPEEGMEALLELRRAMACRLRVRRLGMAEGVA